MVIIDQPQKNHQDTVVPRSYATPSYAIFKGPKKTQVKLFSSKLHYFSPLLRYFLLFPPVTLPSMF